MDVVAILVMWPRPFKQTLVPASHGGSTLNLALIGNAISEKKIFENGGQMDEGQTDGSRLEGYTISSPCEPNGSGELKI